MMYLIIYKMVDIVFTDFYKRYKDKRYNYI